MEKIYLTLSAKFRLHSFKQGQKKLQKAKNSQSAGFEPARGDPN